MRILFISEFFYPHWTGMAKSILKTALRLKEKGHTCGVLATRHDRNLPFFELYKGLEIYRSSPLLNISRTNYSINIIFKFISLAKNYDLIFINTPNSNIAWFTLIAKLFAKPSIIFLNGDLILPKGFLNRVIEKIFDFSMYFSCSLSSVVSTYTLDYAKHSRILSRYLNKFVPLLLPVMSLEKGIDKECDLRMKKLRSDKKATYLVGFAGRFVEEKAFDIMLKAIPKVIEKCPSVHFVYAGKPADYEDFFQRNKSLWDKNQAYLTNMDFLKEEQEMNAFYKNLDLFVISSRSDCFPNVQIEAIEHSVPIVVTDIPGARWPVKMSGFGKIAKPESEESLSCAILDALSDRAQLMSKSHKANQILSTEIFFKQFSALKNRLALLQQNK